MPRIQQMSRGMVLPLLNFALLLQLDASLPLEAAVRSSTDSQLVQLGHQLWVLCAGHLLASCAHPGAAVGCLPPAAGLADALPPAAPQAQQRALLTDLLRSLGGQTQELPALRLPPGLQASQQQLAIAIS